MDIEFSTITLNDGKWIIPLLRQSDFQSCEYCFANNLAWQRLSDSKICRYKDFYFLRSMSGDEPRYIFPSGSGDLKELTEKLREDAAAFSSPLVFTSVLSEGVQRLKEIYGDNMMVQSDRDAFDYIYLTEQLITLSGKKYHGKRNHIANFKKSQWEYKPLEEPLFNDCIEFATNDFNARNAYTSGSAVAEQYAINTFFSCFDELSLKGGVLYQNGRMVGFTIGEKLNSDTFIVHIEKALHDVQGAYPTLFNEFLKANAGDCKYVNREDDVGLEGLRKSKLSYHPEYLLEKFNVTINI